jgi:hypothetical protein
MEEPADAGQPTEKKKRKYTLSKKALAARRANIQKAHQAPKDLIYRPTEKRDAATMANLEKAIAGRKSPEGNERCRMNALKAGFYARDMATSVMRLGEDRKAYIRHLLQFNQFFAPEGTEEGEAIIALGDACWRCLRLYPAQVSWEFGQLEQYFSKVEQLSIDNRQSSISAEDTLTRAYCLPNAPLHRDHLEEQTQRIWAEIVRLLQDFIGLRSDGQLEFHPLAPPRVPAYSRQETQTVTAAIERAKGSRQSAAAPEVGRRELGVGPEEFVAPRLPTPNSPPPSVAGRLPTPVSRFPSPVTGSPFPASDLIAFLTAVFLPVDRKERSILRRMAQFKEFYFARYAEEAQHAADRLSAFLTAASAGIADCRFPIDDCRSPESGWSSQSSIDNRQSSNQRLLAIAQSLLDVLFPKVSLRDELDEIEVSISTLLDEVVRKRSGGLLHLEIYKPKQHLDYLASLIDAALVDAPKSGEGTKR